MSLAGHAGRCVVAGFDLLGPARSPGGSPLATRGRGRDSGVRQYRPTICADRRRPPARALAAVITKVITEWWPTGLVLDWMQTVHRVWPSIHRLRRNEPAPAVVYWTVSSHTGGAQCSSLRTW